MPIVTSEGRIVPVHGDHHPVEVYAARESRNLLDPAARYDTYANVRFYFPRTSTDGLTLHAGKTYTLVVFPGNYERPSGVYFNRNIEPYKTENLAKKYDSYSVSFTPTTDVENVSTNAYWGAGHEPSDVSAVKIMLFEGVGDVPYEPYGTVTDTIFKPTNLKKSGTEVTFEKSYNHSAEVEVAGKSEQAQLSGKNLIPFPYVAKSAELNGVSFTVNDDGSVTAKGTATGSTYFTLSGGYASGMKPIPSWLEPGKTYTMSAGSTLPVGTGMHLYRYTSNTAGAAYAYMYGGATSKTFTMPTNDSEWLYFGLFLYVQKDATVDFTWYPQLELDSTATPYEPYCGGIPSPNPEYPQPIESIDSVELVSRNADGTKTATRTIDLQGNQLRSLPDGTEDELRVYRNGRVELVKRVERSDVDSMYLKNASYIATSNGSYLHGIQPTGAYIPTSGNELQPLMCNTFPVYKTSLFNSTAANTDNVPRCGYYINSNLRFYLPSSYGIVGVDSFVQYLNSIGTVVDYALREPQTITLPSIDPIPTYWPTTVIYDQDGNDISAFVKVIE